ncbi:MAG: membrane protein insertase YidC, partial [Acidobacteriota bacterium]
METPGNNNQTRFLIAAVLSMVVLFGYSYFFAPKRPVDNTNANVAANTNTAQSATPQPAPTAQTTQPQTVAETTPDTTPNRTITIKSPLYEVTLDSKGAIATSWVLLQNRSPKEERQLWADGSTDSDKKPLQLISPEALAKSPREVPFRLSTDDTAINGFINDRNYAVTGADGDVVLAAGQEKQIDFTLTDASGVEVTKTFVFRADNYIADLSVKLTKGGQAVPNSKLLIGASVGDQAIQHHSFYHIEPEAIAFVNDAESRHPGTGFTFDPNNQSTLSIPGNVNWAGVADAYFAMVAIPSQQAQAVEYRASKYEFATAPYYDGIISFVTQSKKSSETRHLITAYLPIAADGSVTRVYTGTKDYFTLKDYNSSLTASVGRNIDIVPLINFSNYSWIRPITSRLAIPIIYSLNFFNGLTHNYGVAIIVFTFLFYMLLFPLRWSQSRSFKKASGNA